MTADNPTFSLEAAGEVFFSDTASSDAIAYAVRAGRARKLGPRLYTKTVDGDEHDVTRRNWAAIAAGYFPGAVIAGRTALDARPAEDGSVFLTVPSLRRPRNVDLPGLRLRAEPGLGPQVGDSQFMGQNIRLSSRGRAYMSNLRTSRARAGAVRRTLTRAELEDSLETYGRFDDTALNRLREDAKDVASPLGYEPEFEALDAIIGTLLGTRDLRLTSSRAQAAAKGLSYDSVRIDRFTELATTLLAAGLPAPAADGRDDISVLAFYESYFSNYIEGTEFTVGEARDIVFGGVVPQQRPKDAHDILGTYQMVVDRFQRTRVPTSPDELVAILLGQHGAMLAARPEIGPGAFKTANNHVGGREFVDRRLVEGTLRQAFPLYTSLSAGFARAAFAMFLVAEVHPFADGNGRIARLLMNSELSDAGQQRILVTTRRRGDYLAALRGMTNDLNVPAFIATLSALQRESAAVDFSSLGSAQAQLEAGAAFVDPDAEGGDSGGLLGIRR